MLGKELRGRVVLIGLSVILNIGILVSKRGNLVVVLNELIGIDLIERSVIESFMVLMRIILLISIVISMPLIWYHIYMFICKGLFKYEQERLLRYMLISVILFTMSILGFRWCYESLRDVFYGFKSVGLVNIDSLGVLEFHYKFIVDILVCLIMLCQIPVILEILVLMRIVSSLKLLEYRKYFIMVGIINVSLIGGLDIILNSIGMIGLVIVYEAVCIRNRLNELI